MHDIKLLPDPVHWYEGMLLSPQHFQRNNQYLEQLLFYTLKSSVPYFWGIKQIKIENEALASRNVVVSMVEAIMPDGSVVRHAATGMSYPEQVQRNDGQDAPFSNLTLNLDELTNIKEQEPFLIYIAVPPMTEGCASDEETDLKRYDSVKIASVTDYNNINNQISIERLRLRYKLLAENQFNGGNYSGVPILKLMKKYDGTYDVLDFYPPMLKVRQGDYALGVGLASRIAQLMEKIRAKAIKIRDYFSRNKTYDRVTVALQNQRIHHLTAHIPTIESLLQSHHAHPFVVYQALVQMVGHMSVLTDDILPPVLKPYTHEDLFACFDEVLSYVENLSDTIRLNFSSITFEQDENNRYSAPVAAMPAGNTFCLVCKVNNGSNIEQLKEWLKFATIGSENHWSSLRLARTTGAYRSFTNSFANMNLHADDDEVFVLVDTQKGHIDANEPLHIQSNDDSMAIHNPATILWLQPIESEGK